MGPAHHLLSHAIEVKVDLPGVGSDLQDHPGVPLTYLAPRRDTLHVLSHPMRWFLEALKFVFFGSGWFLYPLVQMAIFVRSDLFASDTSVDTSSPSKDPPSISPVDLGTTTTSEITIQATLEDLNSHNPTNVPDIEIIPIPCAVGPSASSHLASGPHGAVSLYCILLRPLSKGSVRLANRDPRTLPVCELALLQDAGGRDGEVMRKALRLGMTLARRTKQGGYPLVDLDVPSSGPDPKGKTEGHDKGTATGTASDDELNRFIDTHLQSSYHYSSTCRMGKREDGGVVDDRLRVHGVQGLRIADASVFPRVLAAHLQASIGMVAERCAEFLKEEHGDGKVDVVYRGAPENV
jgi:choline dehydrogenase